MDHKEEKSELDILIEGSEVVKAFKKIKREPSTVNQRTKLAMAAIKTKRYGIAAALIRMGVKDQAIKALEKAWPKQKPEV